MKTANLFRVFSNDQGTFGVISFDHFQCYSLELPWKDNAQNISCIPEGKYTSHWQRSPKFGHCYKLANVPNRSHILIHPGNLAGDKVKGYKTHTWGCILLGTKYGFLNKQFAVLNSRTAVRQLSEQLNQSNFTLEISK